jgi:hypothetical protein
VRTLLVSRELTFVTVGSVSSKKPQIGCNLEVVVNVKADG